MFFSQIWFASNKILLVSQESQHQHNFFLNQSSLFFMFRYLFVFLFDNDGSFWKNNCHKYVIAYEKIYHNIMYTLLVLIELR